MTKLFTPSTTDLGNMLKAAEDKFNANREQCLRAEFAALPQFKDWDDDAKYYAFKGWQAARAQQEPTP